MKTKPYRPRVLIPFNTGTRIIKSKRDKMRSRQYLNRLANQY